VGVWQSGSGFRPSTPMDWNCSGVGATSFSHGSHVRSTTVISIHARTLYSLLLTSIHHEVRTRVCSAARLPPILAWVNASEGSLKIAVTSSAKNVALADPCIWKHANAGTRSKLPLLDAPVSFSRFLWDSRIAAASLYDTTARHPRVKQSLFD